MPLSTPALGEHELCSHPHYQDPLISPLESLVPTPDVAVDMEVCAVVSQAFPLPTSLQFQQRSEYFDVGEQFMKLYNIKVTSSQQDGSLGEERCLARLECQPNSQAHVMVTGDGQVHNTDFKSAGWLSR